MNTRHLRLVSDRGPIAKTNPARPDVGVDLNRVAHAEYRARQNPVDIPLEGPIMQREPVLPMWAVVFAAFFIVGICWQVGRAVL